MATRVAALIQLSDPRVAAQLVDIMYGCTHGKVTNDTIVINFRFGNDSDTNCSRAQNTRRHAALCRAAAVTCREALKMCGRCAARLAAMP